MRKIVTFFAFPAVTGAALVAAVGWWRRNPRIGTAFVNSVVNPALLRRGLAGYGRSEIGTLEHVGRKSGVRRLTQSIRSRHRPVFGSSFRSACGLSGRAT